MISTINFLKQRNRSDVIGFDLAENFTRPALECSDHVGVFFVGSDKRKPKLTFCIHGS
jgi:hypothetical protein